jgi:putative copper resistance protein D
MSLLIDLFGYLTIVLHGLTLTAQSVAVGGVLFVLFLARPLAARLFTGPEILRRAARIAAWGAVALIACDLAALAMQSAVLTDTLGIPLSGVLGAEFARALLAKIAASVLLALLLASGAATRGGLLPNLALLLAVLVELSAATLTTHAAARMDGRTPLLLAEGLHQLGAAIWIGGLPCFLLALNRVQDAAGWRQVGRRYSQMSMVGVFCITVSGAAMWLAYVGNLPGFYGTAYGVMVGAKMAMFAGLLGLGAGNYKLIERLQRNPAVPVIRLKRFAEVELGIGGSLFFAAASLTSVPPAVDLTQDRVSLHEIVERNTPAWPRLVSPDHDKLALPALQAQLDQAAAVAARHPAPAFTPGSGVIPPRNADDVAWSEYNHHWSGIFVLAIALLALLNQAGLRWARHWPLLFLGLAAFLFVRSDPETWPMGNIGLLESLRDVEVLQHRVFVLLIIIFGLFEWRVRTGGLARGAASLVFPLITAAGGALLLTHSHAIANVKDQLLIELTHTPLALAGISAGWARWLEIRLPGRGGRIAGWVWPLCFVLVGLLLMNYREA